MGIPKEKGTSARWMFLFLVILSGVACVIGPSLWRHYHEEKVSVNTSGPSAAATSPPALKTQRPAASAPTIPKSILDFSSLARYTRSNTPLSAWNPDEV